MVWSGQWSDEEIAAVRKKDARASAAYFGTGEAGKSEAPPPITERAKNKDAKGGFKKGIKKWFGGKGS